MLICFKAVSYKTGSHSSCSCSENGYICIHASKSA
ncbi:SWIM zinc finger family protein [Pseudochrobactrum sp. MP213Fo]